MLSGFVKLKYEAFMPFFQVHQAIDPAADEGCVGPSCFALQMYLLGAERTVM